MEKNDSIEINIVSENLFLFLFLYNFNAKFLYYFITRNFSFNMQYRRIKRKVFKTISTSWKQVEKGLNLRSA